MKRSLSDAILSILNFDYCVETLVKAVLLDTNIPLRKRGKPKSFDELIEDIRGLYPNLGYTPEALSLHKLRNDVQHQSQIPSQHDVERHVITARFFFDEVCLKVYDGSITFAHISLALFVTSEVENIILAEMEKALQDERFSDSVFYAKQAVAYHVRLLRHSMKVPHSWHSHSLHFDLDHAGLGKLGRFVEDTDEKLDWIVDRLCLREYYDEIVGFIGRGFRYEFRLRGLERETANQDDGEKARTITYDFITRTQDLIHEPDLETPFVFDLLVSSKRDNECAVQVGLASAHKIIEAKLTLGGQNVEKSVQNISTQLGLQTVNVKDLEKGKKYDLIASVKTEKDYTDSEYLTFEM